MAESYTLLLLSAQPVESVQSENLQEYYTGAFLCSSAQPDALQLLDDTLGKMNLTRIQSGESVSIPKTEPLGLYEGLKDRVEEQGYGISLVVMRFPKA